MKRYSDNTVKRAAACIRSIRGRLKERYVPELQEIFAEGTLIYEHTLVLKDVYDPAKRLECTLEFGGHHVYPDCVYFRTPTESFLLNGHDFGDGRSKGDTMFDEHGLEYERNCEAALLLIKNWPKFEKSLKRSIGRMKTWADDMAGSILDDAERYFEASGSGKEDEA